METEPINPEIPKESWFEQARDGWDKADTSKHQDWLAELAKSLNLEEGKPQHHFFVIKHKTMKFNELPSKYQEMLTEKWGMIE